MNVRAYKLFARSELAHIQSVLEETARRWAHSWIKDEPVPEVAVTACGTGRTVDDGHGECTWQLASAGGHQWLAIAHNDDVVLSASSLLSGGLTGGNGHLKPDSILSAGLARKFLHDLADSIIMQSLGNAVKNTRNYPVAEGCLPAEAEAPGSGAVRVEITLRGAVFLLILGPGLTSACLSGLAETPAPPAPLTSRMRVIDPISVTVNAKIGNAVLSLGDLRNMKTGDVIRLDAKLSQPVRVFLNRQAVCEGFLGAYRENKTILMKSSTR